MAEKWTPEEVVARLNEYFQAMTDIVFQYDSAVDKYMGDALMALFGIPVPHPDHPRRAVAAAIDMQTALRELQAQWQAQGLPLIDIGIGINTGEMVVGNIGSKERQDFTVIGDAVNLASRVESLNKELHTRILITAATYEFIQDEVEVRGPLIMHVRGREEEVIVYEVLGWRNATADASGAAKNGSRERAQRIVPGFPGPTKIGPGSRVR
jgi:adenylate cyclase